MSTQSIVEQTQKTSLDPVKTQSPTPPPVPSEIEGEINRLIIENLDNGKLSITGKESLVSLKKALTALLTNHTSVQVKEKQREDSLIRSYLWSVVREKVRKEGKDWWHEYGHILHDIDTNKAGARDYYLKLATAQAAGGEGE